MFYKFKDMLAYSQGTVQDSDIETIKALIPGCTEVRKTDKVKDISGVDYEAVLRGGRIINIDAKTRQPGASKFWKNNTPEIALEKWSVIPTANQKGKVGWTLDEGKQTEMILFTFDPSDCDEVYLVSFQLLRMAFRRNIHNWWAVYKHAPQTSDGWKSEAVFVPVDIALRAITEISKGKIASVLPKPHLEFVPLPPKNSELGQLKMF